MRGDWEAQLSYPHLHTAPTVTVQGVAAEQVCSVEEERDPQKPVQFTGAWVFSKAMKPYHSQISGLRLRKFLLRSTLPRFPGAYSPSKGFFTDIQSTIIH